MDQSTLLSCTLMAVKTLPFTGAASAPALAAHGETSRLTRSTPRKTVPSERRHPQRLRLATRASARRASTSRLGRLAQSTPSTFPALVLAAGRTADAA